MKKQFAGLLKDVGFISSSHPKDEMANVNSTNLKLVKAVLCAGLYPNVIKIEQKKPGGYVYLHFVVLLCCLFILELAIGAKQPHSCFLSYGSNKNCTRHCPTMHNMYCTTVGNAKGLQLSTNYSNLAIIACVHVVEIISIIVV